MSMACFQTRSETHSPKFDSACALVKNLVYEHHVAAMERSGRRSIRETWFCAHEFIPKQIPHDYGCVPCPSSRTAFQRSMHGDRYASRIAYTRLWRAKLSMAALSLDRFVVCVGRSDVEHRLPAGSPLLVTQVAEHSGAGMAGSAAGIANEFWQSGSTLAPVVVGVVFQMTHSFPSAFGALAVGPLFGLLCMLFVREDTGR
jgi:hypothetical protein